MADPATLPADPCNGCVEPLCTRCEQPDDAAIDRSLAALRVWISPRPDHRRLWRELEGEAM